MFNFNTMTDSTFSYKRQASINYNVYIVKVTLVCTVSVSHNN